MAEKNLGGSSWKAFAKGRGYKDAALLKALEALEKADKGPPAALPAALDEVGKQAELLRKLHKADKELIAWLAGIDKSLALERKAVPPPAAPASKALAGPALDAKSQALLGSAMVPLLAQVKKGDVMRAAIAIAGKDAAVLVSRHDLGPTGRKLLTVYLGAGAGAGVKFIAGECRFEENAHTFVVQASAGGLAKRLQAALLKQTGLRLPGLRVRGDDPNEVDRDDEDVGATPAVGKTATAAPTAGSTTPQATAKAPTPTSVKPSGASTAQASTPAPAPASAQAKAAYDARLAKLLTRLKQPAHTAAAEGAKLKALLVFAQGKAREQNHAAALLGLGEVEKLLDAAPPASAATTATAAAPPTAAARPKATEAGEPARTAQPERPRPSPDETARPAAKPAFDEAAFRRRWTTVKGGWRDALDSVDAQIAKLQTALRKLGDAELTQIADKGLNGITGNFKTPVLVAVMEVDNARGEAALKKAAQKGVRAAKAFAAYLASEATVRVTDENPFGVPMTIRASLGQALKDIEAVLVPLA